VREKEERFSILLIRSATRWSGAGPVDVVLALALIYHLVISNKVLFGRLSDFLAELGKWLIVEFVPKANS